VPMKPPLGWAMSEPTATPSYMQNFPNAVDGSCKGANRK
jgi:hypothetical protein